MKKIFNIFALGLPLMFSSCSDFLEVEPQNIITIDQFWNEQSDVESIITGCYSKMASYDVISRMMIWGEFRSENIYMYGSTIEKDINLERVLKENITANNAYTNWTGFYDVINRCNIVIQYAPQVAEKDPSYTQGEVRAHIAEATALRSLCYFYLIRTFRDVPYTEEAFLDDSQDLALPAQGFEYVLDKLIVSLEGVMDDAVKKYPVSSFTSRMYDTARITRSSIWAMLCEMYLWKQDYDNCIKYADLIIEAKTKDAEEDDPTADYTLTNDFPLIPSRYPGSGNSYGNAFTAIFSEGNSSESIFEISFDKNGSQQNTPSNTAVGDIYGSGTLHRVRPSDLIMTDVKNKSYKIFKNEYDGRNYENFRYTSDGIESINKYRCRGSIILTFNDINKIYSQSGSTAWGTIYPTGDKDVSYNKANFIIYRLSDIMLLKAEALAQKMSDATDNLSDSDLALRDASFNLVNAVNKRSLYIAHNDSKFANDTLVVSDYGTKTTITNLVYEERQRELMFEGKRYYDLVRRARREGNTDYLRDKVKQKDISSATIVDNLMKKMDAIYWPYNLDELKVNKYLVQNSAFGSGENGSYQNSYK